MPSLRSTRSSERPRHSVRHEDEYDDAQFAALLDEEQKTKKKTSGKDDEGKLDNAGDEEDDVDDMEEDEDEEEAETRCICGQSDPPDDNGLYIQCEKCSVWQHGFCVSISDNVPEKYWCESCRPELHTIVVRPGGGGRISRYLPVQPKEKRRAGKRGGASQKVERDQGEEDGEEVDADDDEDDEDDDDEHNSKRRRDRSTGSTREDARFEALMQRVIEESKRDAKSEGGSGSGRSRRRQAHQQHSGSGIESKEMSVSEALKPHDDDSQADDKNSNDDMKMEERNHSSRSSRGRSRRVHNDSNMIESSADDSKVDDSLNHNNETRVQRLKREFTENESETNDSTSNSSKPKKQKKNNKSTNNKPKDKEKDSSVNFNIPTKPRLPQQRSTINEMRKRVAAILEFIGRTQLDIANEQDDHLELTKYIEDEKIKKDVELMFENKKTLELMDVLTRKLLNWEQQFGKYGDRY